MSHSIILKEQVMEIDVLIPLYSVQWHAKRDVFEPVYQ